MPKGNKRLAKECNNPKPVYCICREGERPGMIGCDFCDEWYHTQCLGLTKDEAKRISNEKWSCVKCELKLYILKRNLRFLVFPSEIRA